MNDYRAADKCGEVEYERGWEEELTRLLEQIKNGFVVNLLLTTHAISLIMIFANRGKHLNFLMFPNYTFYYQYDKYRYHKCL